MEQVLSSLSAADNFTLKEDPTHWEFFVFNHPNPVGFARNFFMSKAKWNGDKFTVDHTARTVKLKYSGNVSKRKKLDGTEFVYVTACNDAMEEFCRSNTHICTGFQPWLDQSPEQRDYHPIIGLDAPLMGLQIPTPARGIFGIATAGIHANVYTPKMNGDQVVFEGGRPVVAIVWVSKRSAHATFPHTSDQVIGGAVTTKDEMIPFKAFQRKALQEANMNIELNTNDVFSEGSQCGKYTEGPTLSFYTLKGDLAGDGEHGHLEPAIRFVYDIELKPGFEPKVNTKDADEFIPVKVEDIIKYALTKEWKYSSFVVFIDFLMRFNLLEGLTDAQKNEIQLKTRRDLPLLDVKPWLARVAEIHTLPGV